MLGSTPRTLDTLTLSSLIKVDIFPSLLTNRATFYQSQRVSRFMQGFNEASSMVKWSMGRCCIFFLYSVQCSLYSYSYQDSLHRRWFRLPAPQPPPTSPTSNNPCHRPLNHLPSAPTLDPSPQVQTLALPGLVILPLTQVRRMSRV